MRRSPFGVGWSPLDDLITPPQPRHASFVLPLLLDDDEPEEEKTSKRTMSEKDLPPSVKEKLERKRRR
ncbi:MAG: hypothetical protein IJP42_01060 [Selenomonadaceae bacterium]|nr:hypothetical protein [Selenomonadaceae bacterium]MBR0103879.1 hypothetical protein [Selenomonadaceae bacterium]